MNLYHVTKFSPYFSFTVYCFYTKISSFTPALSIRIALDCFYLLIFYSEKFSTDVCRLPYAVNVNLNLSNNYFWTKIIVFKPGLANGRNIFGQQLPTMLDVTCCVRLRCCVLLGVFAQRLKPVKFSLAMCKRTQQLLTMLRPFARRF